MKPRFVLSLPPKKKIVPEIGSPPFGGARRIYLTRALTLPTGIQLPAIHTAVRHSIASKNGHGILTVCPSGAAFAIPLGPTNPWLIYIAKETLVFRRAGISPALRLLVPTFLLRNAPEWVTPFPSSRMRILSYRWILHEAISSPQFRYNV